jgi:ATP-binding cassette subfamily C protein
MIARLPDGYETMIDGSGAPLSGGQKQRVALARALFDDPALIILDEPNSNLDAEGEQALTETLQRAKQRSVTVVVVTQRPVLLGSVDKVLILRSGRMEAWGPPDQVLRRPVANSGSQYAAPADGNSNGTARVQTS